MINKGTCEIKLSRFLTVTDHGVVSNIDPDRDGVLRS